MQQYGVKTLNGNRNALKQKQNALCHRRSERKFAGPSRPVVHYYYYYYYYYLPSVSRIPRDLEKNDEWPLLRTVVANEGVVEQYAIESLHQDGQTLK